MGTQIAPVVRPLTPVYRQIGRRPGDSKRINLADVQGKIRRPHSRRDRCIHAWEDRRRTSFSPKYRLHLLKRVTQIVMMSSVSRL